MCSFTFFSLKFLAFSSLAEYSFRTLFRFNAEREQNLNSLCAQLIKNMRSGVLLSYEKGAISREPIVSRKIFLGGRIQTSAVIANQIREFFPSPYEKQSYNKTREITHVT